MNELSTAFVWSEKLILFALSLQTLEYIQVRSWWKIDGCWSWNLLRDEVAETYPGLVNFSDFIFREDRFLWLLRIRLMLCGLGFFFGNLCIFFLLFISQIVLSFRWRGSFNGGSDSMTTHSLLGLCLWHVCGGTSIGAWYVSSYFTFQVVLSYLCAGYVKLKNSDWWHGKIIQTALVGGGYPVPAWAMNVAQTQPTTIKAISFFILSFEILFPLALLNKTCCIIFLSFGATFHFINAILLGLNRFFWIWIATYPVVYALAGIIPIPFTK